MNIEEKYLTERFYEEDYSPASDIKNIAFKIVKCCASCSYYDNYHIEICINKNVKKMGEEQDITGSITTTANGLCKFYHNKE